MVKPDQPLRVAVIGLGFGQQVHVPAFRCDPRCEVTMLCASTEAKAAEIAGRLNVPRSSGDWRRVVCDADIEAVSIAVQPRLQPEIAIAALEHGKAVFCEKPLAAHPHEALAALRAAGRSRCAMVNFEFCECDAWREALLHSGRPGRSLADPYWIGCASSVKVDWRVQTYANRNRLQNWKSRPEDGGGALQAFVAHTFHTLELFLEGPICRLKARLSKSAGDPRPGETEVDIEVQFLLGGSAIVHVATDAPPPHHHRIELAGHGALTLLNEGSDYIDGFRVLYTPPAPPTMAPVPAQIFPSAGQGAAQTRDGRVEATSRLVEKFVTWALGGEAAHPNFADGYRVQSLIEAARRSNSEDRWVDTPL
jgi:predicted dehydrogenase